jgi:hypothetical protein
MRGPTGSMWQATTREVRLARRFWTLPFGRMRRPLQAFVTVPPHAAVMKALAPHMGATRFTRRIVKSPELPLRWDDALKRSDPAE